MIGRFRISCWVFLLLLLGSAGSALLAEESVEPPFLGLVTGDRVNLRAGPSFSYEILFQFGRRTQVQVMAAQADWYAVPLPDHLSAYIHRDYLAVEGQRTYVRGERVQVRAGPGRGSAPFGLLSSPEQVRVRGSSGEWMEIQPPGFCRGWVHRSYVTFLEREEKRTP